MGNLFKEAIHFMPAFTLTDAQARARAQHSPASERNRQPILDVLQRVLPASGTALEIASGTGQHVAFFAAAMPQWTWQPSDLSGSAFDSIAAWCVQEGVENVRVPVVLDVTSPRWPVDGAEFASQAFDAIYCANMLHIAPWAACCGLMQGAACYLAPRGLLVTYGPYLEQDVTTSQGNLDFDISLRQRNPSWGIRALHDVAQEASRAGLRLAQRHQMPANNLLLVWERA
jgi:hypothetical protein